MNIYIHVYTWQDIIFSSVLYIECLFFKIIHVVKIKFLHYKNGFFFRTNLLKTILDWLLLYPLSSPKEPFDLLPSLCVYLCPWSSTFWKIFSSETCEPISIKLWLNEVFLPNMATIARNRTQGKMHWLSYHMHETVISKDNLTCLNCSECQNLPTSFLHQHYIYLMTSWGVIAL